MHVSWGAESAARRATTAGAARRRECAPAASRERGDCSAPPTNPAFFVGDVAVVFAFNPGADDRLSLNCEAS